LPGLSLLKKASILVQALERVQVLELHVLEAEVVLLVGLQLVAIDVEHRGG
jgi:hypothetical protein